VVYSTSDFSVISYQFPARNKLRLEVGTPDFQLPDITNGRLVKLSDYKGKQPVLVAFTRIFTDKQYCPLLFSSHQSFK
jgi:hypothetical protein